MTNVLRTTLGGLLLAGGVAFAQGLPPREAPGLGSPSAPFTQIGPISFEVASVKPNKSGNGPQNARLSPGGRVEVTNMPLRALLRISYGAAIQSANQIVGLPGWADSDRYDIVAKAEGDLGFDASSGQPLRLIAMLRALLEDRFKIKLHSEMRDVPVYALMLVAKDGKLGPQLKESHADCYSPASPPPQGAAPDPSRFCGVRGGNGNVTYSGVAMSIVVNNLATFPVVGRPVVDRTGLTGRYDLHIEFVPAFIPSPTGDGSQVANPAADSGSNLFTALVEQAGLKLQAERGPVEFIVVDRAERPTED